MTRYQDDFYDAINLWRGKTAVIPADDKSEQVAIDLDEEIEELMLANNGQVVGRRDVPEDAILANFVATIAWYAILIREKQMGIKPRPSSAQGNIRIWELWILPANWQSSN